MDEIDEAAGRKGAGRDALRFFFLSRSANSNVEFDIELAKKKSLDNPVFYVQYGHARLCSILRKARGHRASSRARHRRTPEWAKLVHPDELALAHEARGLPRRASPRPRALREPHRVVFYVQELARDFQSYFTRLKGDTTPSFRATRAREDAGWEASWDFGKTHARLALDRAIRAVYASALDARGRARPSAWTARRPRPRAEATRSGSRSVEPETWPCLPVARYDEDRPMREPGSIRNLEQLQERRRRAADAARRDDAARRARRRLRRLRRARARRPNAARRTTQKSDPLGELVRPAVATRPGSGGRATGDGALAAAT